MYMPLKPTKNLNLFRASSHWFTRRLNRRARFVTIDFLTLIALATFSGAARADTASVLRKYVGYTIIYAGEITGWRDENGKKGDAFEGCEFGRVLVIDYSKQVTCSGYGYQYGYHPTAVFLKKGGSLKMIVEGDEYDVY